LSSIASSKTISLMVVTTVIGPACVTESKGIFTPPTGRQSFTAE